VRGGVAAVTDGPFAEAKEQLGGYLIVDCESPERATRRESEQVNTGAGADGQEDRERSRGRVRQVGERLPAPRALGEARPMAAHPPSVGRGRRSSGTDGEEA
jgi:hypothetical protein